MSGRGPRQIGTIKNSFSDYSWAEIIAACQRKRIPASWKIGDQKAMTINGVEYLFDIIGFDHDDYADGSGKAPITLQMHDCYADQFAINATTTSPGGWKECAMRTTYLPSILELMPEEIQSGIREVSKSVCAEGGSTTVETVSDKLFLLSEIEIFGEIKYSVEGEGAQYEYYSDGDKTVKDRAGSTSSGVIWWERSPYSGNKTYFCWVRASGVSYRGSANGDHGVAFAFCF